MFTRRLKILSKYLDGALSARAAGRLDRRLYDDAGLRRRLEVLRLMDSALPDCNTSSEEFKARIVSRLPDVRRSTQPVWGAIESLTGDAWVGDSEEAGGRIPVFEGMALRHGDLLRPDRSAVVLVRLNDGSRMYVNSETEVRVGGTAHSLFLRVGQVFVTLRRQPSPFSVKTPSALLEVVGTHFDAKATGSETTRLRVFKGAVGFHNKGGKTIVKRRHEVTADVTCSPTPTPLRRSVDPITWTKSVRKKETKGSTFMKLTLGVVVVIVLVLVGWRMFSQGAEGPALPATSSPLPAVAANLLGPDREILTNGVNKAHSLPNLMITYPASDAQIRAYVEGVARHFHPQLQTPATLKADTEITEDDIRTRNIYIYGTPANHSLLGRIAAQLPIQIQSDGIVAGNTKYVGKDVGVIMACPNPLSPDHMVIVYGGVSSEALENPNSVFHGPTDYVIYNSKTLHMRQPGDMGRDLFLVQGGFDRSDPKAWKVNESLQMHPPDYVTRDMENVIVPNP